MDDTESVPHDGRRLAWRTTGRGPTLLLLQGYAGSAADWDPTFLAALAGERRVVCPDPRGVGDSTVGDPDEPFTIESMADDAVAVLDALGVERATVAGWSMGGFVAQALACRSPHRVDALALLGTDAGGPTAVRADGAVWSQLLDDSGPPRQQATRLLRLLFPEPLATELDEQVGDLVAQARAALDPTVLRAQARAMDAWHTTEPGPVPATVPPVVALAGARDVVIPPANLERLARRWPGCRTLLVPGAGHAVMAQEPAATAGAVSAIAERRTPRRRGG